MPGGFSRPASLIIWCYMPSTAIKPCNLCPVQGQLGPFIKARQHVFIRDDMYISLAGRHSQRQAGPHVAQREAVDAPPGFADRPAPSQSHSQRGEFCQYCTRQRPATFLEGVEA